MKRDTSSKSKNRALNQKMVRTGHPKAFSLVAAASGPSRLPGDERLSGPFLDFFWIVAPPVVGEGAQLGQVHLGREQDSVAFDHLAAGLRVHIRALLIGLKALRRDHGEAQSGGDF